MSIGDVTSQERGSGARFNDGKPAVELIALRVMADTWAIVPELEDLAPTMQCLAEFQETGKLAPILRAIYALGEPWAESASVFDYGRKKYAEFNWAKGMKWSVPLACAVRHLLALRRGETLDPESGLPHAGHVLCNLVMLATFVRTYPEGNDLPIKWLGSHTKTPEQLSQEALDAAREQWLQRAGLRAPRTPAHLQDALRSFKVPDSWLADAGARQVGIPESSDVDEMQGVSAVAEAIMEAVVWGSGAVSIVSLPVRDMKQPEAAAACGAGCHCDCKGVK